MIFSVRRASRQPTEPKVEINTLEDLLQFIETQEDCLSIIMTRCNKEKTDGAAWYGLSDWEILIYDDWVE